MDNKRAIDQSLDGADGVGKLVKTCLDHPKVVEAVVMGVLYGVMHFLKAHGVGGGNG